MPAVAAALLIAFGVRKPPDKVRVPGDSLTMEMDDDACYRAIEARDRRFDGRFFVGVTTTGVYCRPFCPAPTPKRGNVRFFSTAAAAQENGFRPCLRCRPEIAPVLAVAWRGSANTVSRALQLIEAGALDNADVETLGDRLGVAGRHLRRLFKQHLGASPVSVAQTRRVLLAKQLIQDTRLPMAEIAAAAGFGSIRRFNETFQRLYQRPPRSLRRSSVTEESAAETGAVTVRLGYRPPYDWASVVSILHTRAIPGVEVVSIDGYARTITIGDDGCGVLIIKPTTENCLKATVRVHDLRMLPTIVACVRRVFDLSADPAAIGAHLGHDPLLAPLVAARPGLRAPGMWDGFEGAVRAVLGLYASAEPKQLAGRLAACFGAKVNDLASHDQGLTHAFPTARQLAGAELAAAGVPQAAREVLVSLATAAATDPMIFGPYGSAEEAITRLQSLPGMNDRAVRCIAASGLPDADPFTDMYSLSSCATLHVRSEHWRPWRAHAVLHLWAADPGAKPRSKEVDLDQHVA